MKNKMESNQVVKMTTKTQTKVHHNKRHMPKPFEVVVILVFIFLFTCLGVILIAGMLSNHQPSSAHAFAQQTLIALNTTTTVMPEPKTTGTPEATPDPIISPTPTEKVLQKPEGQVNILLLGSDARPDTGGFRTDSLTWVSLNPKDGFVSAISFPRDIFIAIPGMGENRINVAFPRGGFDLLADTFEMNFGARPDYYLLIDMNGFKSVINNLGGINVQTASNLTDTCAKWINPSGQCSVGPGLVHMDGEVALWYVRSRYASNDIERARRAQEVIEAIFNRLMSLDAILRAPDLFNAYSSFVDTNLKFGDVVTFLPLASKIYDTRDIRNYVIDFDHVYSWVTLEGAQVLVPDIESIRELMIDALLLE